MQLTELFDNPSALVSVSYLREATAEGTATQTAASNRKINFFDITLRMLSQRYVFIRNRKINRQAVSQKSGKPGRIIRPATERESHGRARPAMTPRMFRPRSLPPCRPNPARKRGGRFP